MQSFHRSRGRIFFEVLCAFGIAASSVAAWMQTFAPAMLAIAGIAGLFGLVRFLDMFGRPPAVAEVAAASAPVTDDRGDLLVYLEADEPEPELVLEAETQVAEAVQEAQPASEPVQQAEPEAAEHVLAVEPELAEPIPEPEIVDEPVEQAEPGDLTHDEPEYAPVAQLFEAEPFARKQRAAFGRKAG